MEVVGKGDAYRRLQAMTSIIISLAAERIGVEEKKAVNRPYIMNNRANKIHQLRQELKSLKRRFKEAREEEKGPVGELRAILRKKLMTLRRAEWHRRRRDNFSDGAREQDLGNCQYLIDPPAPSLDFDGKEPSWKEIQEVIKKARASSAPGPSGVPYRVYKSCPKLQHRLWKILKVIWRRGKVAKQWRFAEGVWSPKEEESKTINQFRIISLLSVEGKIFFSIVARRLTDYLLRNSYIDTSVQKGGIPKVPGCLEQTGVVTQLIREARENKGDLVVLWLDLTNAYGSIPHKLVEEALRRHHIPDKFRNLILDYYDRFSLRVSAGPTTSDWHRLEKGIITGCKISLAMNMLVKAAEVQCRGPLSKSGVRQPPIRAFMDDLMVTTLHVPGARWILKGLEEMTTWARMSFKPTKSRSLVLKKGKVTNKFCFTRAMTQIPSITEKPVKSLGKVFDCSLKDTAAVRATNLELEGWLAIVDKSGLPGKFKAWIYQHGILPRILWPLLIYDVPISTIEGFERRVSRFLRRWLGLPRSLSSIALNGQNNKVSQAGIEVRTGRRWRAAEEVEVAESSLQHRELVGAVAYGRAGLGSGTTSRYNKAQGKDRRSLVQQELGIGGVTSLYPLLEERDPGAHPQLLFEGAGGGALGEGHYRWRHDQVLKAIASTITCGIGHCKRLRSVKKNITFF
ncbi:hypothetical protein DPEC_G00106740 [Dallia pectoralis]|uniref:Uncharacterized protein n=1 Tax=Dallia pectoralis TaxID=75939 RepID=A0ACC2GYF4_DALPE|nr:hypothetical protein DPEC_G00106740 [Dallia pectoralis]